jgi:hypothetical protein
VVLDLAARDLLNLGNHFTVGDHAVDRVLYRFEDLDFLFVCHVVPSPCCVCLIFGIYATDKLNATTEIDMSLKKRERGRPKGRVQDKQLLMRVTAEFLETVDKWRKEQPDELTRSDAIRRLVERGLKYRGK